MSRGRWRFNPPLGVGLICAALLAMAALVNHQNERGRAHSGAEQHAEPAQRNAPETAPVIRAVQEPPANPNPERNEWRDERDLQAQRDMAQWAFWLLIVSSGTLATAIAGVILLKQTLDEAHAANKGFADAARRQSRAYMAIESVSAGFAVDEPGAGMITLRIAVNMRNCGQTPARRVRRTIEVFGREGHSLNPDNSRETRIGFSGDAKLLDIAPGRTFAHVYGGLLARYERTHQPGLFVRGWIEYSDFSGDSWRVPYECESDPFRIISAEPVIRFREVIQFEEERVKRKG